jgi:hypothetical protein
MQNEPLRRRTEDYALLSDLQTVALANSWSDW